MFQKILLAQCDALIHLGCDRSVKEAIKRLWFRFLHYSGYAFKEVILKPLTSTMHGSLPKQKLRFKKNQRVFSPSVGPIPVDKTEIQPSKRKQSSPCEPGPSSLQHEVEAYQDLSKSTFLCEPLTKKQRTDESNIFFEMNMSESYSRECDVKKDDFETGGNAQKDVELVLDSSQIETQSLSQSPEIASFFDDNSSVSNENKTVTNDDTNELAKSKEEVNQYHMLLKKQYGSSHMSVLTLKHTLAICFLGLLYTQQNILLSDFARWIRINKLPYHTVLRLLPENCRKGKFANLFRPNNGDLSADDLYVFLRYFCWYLPLPPLPTIKTTAMCEILIGKLHLPGSFNKIVEKILRCIKKGPTFDGAFLHTHRTFDIQCMAVIVYVLRMIYILNDITEFDMEEFIRQGEDTEESDEYIYPWEDWIALYSKVKIIKLSQSIPTMKSEIPFLTSPNNFVDYCLDLFHSSVPTDTDSETKKPVNVTNAELCNTLKRAQAKIEKKLAKKEPSNSQLKLPTPRRIYLSDLKASKYYFSHECSKLQRDFKKNRFHDIELSHSFRFLLQSCCEILEVAATELYENVCLVESQVIQASLAVNKFYDEISKQPKKKVTSDQQTQTEDAQFPFLSCPPDSQTVTSNDLSERIPVRPWMLVPENTNPEICIPEFRGKYDKKVQTNREKLYPRLSLLSECNTPNNKLNQSRLKGMLGMITTDVLPDDTSFESHSCDSNRDEKSLLMDTVSESSEIATNLLSSDVSD